MRDVLIVSIILGAAPVCLFSPYFGVLMWNWIACFNPHRYAWGFAYRFPVAWIIAVPTLLGTLFARQKTNRHVLVRETVLLVALWAWFGLTTLYVSQEPLFFDHLNDATVQLVRVSKVLLMTVVTIFVIDSRAKLKNLFLVIAFSLGLIGVKGTIYGILTGGQSRVWGPPDSYIADNNEFALAMDMTLPILFFLARDEQKRWLRILMRITFLCGVASVLLTYSRGGLLGLTAVLLALTLQSRRKALAVSLIVISALLVVSFAPQQWMGRMEAFANGNVDTSAQGRLDAWYFAWQLVMHYPITGGGFETFTPALYERYTPGLRYGQAYEGPHSIYFQILGEHGFVGLALFFGLLGCCFGTLYTLKKRSMRMPSIRWIASYSRMLQISMLAFMISGAFLGRAYFDYFFQLVATTIILRTLFRREVERALAETATEPERAAAEEVMLAGQPAAL
jgi:putative inorganic carbon (HCO3(-)) transporter